MPVNHSGSRLFETQCMFSVVASSLLHICWAAANCTFTCFCNEHVYVIWKYGTGTGCKLAVCVNVGHINNLNNTCIWKLVYLKGLTTAEAQERVNVSRIFCCGTSLSLIR